MEQIPMEDVTHQARSIFSIVGMEKYLTLSSVLSMISL